MGHRKSRRVRSASESLIESARSMRSAPTETEETLWRILRGRHVGGLKFRRQYPVGRFILDFYCPALKLGIELDGSVHDEQPERDEERTMTLETAGYRVLRFRNEEILRDLLSVIRRIQRAATERELVEDGE